MQIKLIDLYCKAGGASMGYFQAAQEIGVDIQIFGVDIQRQPNYPFEFIQSDAVKFLEANWRDFTHVHASPPCQKYSNSTARFRRQGKAYSDSLFEIKSLMKSIAIPGVIENVIQAPIAPDIILRGDMFGLKVLRKRHFELVNWFMLNPVMPPKVGSVKDGDYAQVFGKGQLKGNKCSKRVKIPGSINQVWSTAMGINWMTNLELAEAIPPAYTRYIGVDFFKQKLI